ncbi:MAG: uracil-DNA glycosylase [Helicobacteraceae bacterium]|nr:uracil-DNA glycosylase [Helicobacteraceae bacterium]
MINLSEFLVEKSWQNLLKDEFLKPYFLKLQNKYEKSLQSSIVYPPLDLIFNAFNLTPLESLKVVILGQDPYHREGQAMGLSFSVPSGVRIPPSLRNIFKELQRDLGVGIPRSGDLSAWAKQGVLLLNAILSVEANKPTSHKNIGWETFSDSVISKISKNTSGIVFLLWGEYAKSKAALIDKNKHFILSAAHPSPLARGAKDAFLGCGHFSKTNEILKELGKSGIEWGLERTLF